MIRAFRLPPHRIFRMGHRILATGLREPRPYKGLSRMRGNSQVRFLGEPGPETAPGLPGVRFYSLTLESLGRNSGISGNSSIRSFRFERKHD
jgi:hypothetical protein